MYEAFLVALLSSFEIYVAIATGLAFGLSSNVLCIATLIGGISGVFISVFLGEKISEFIAKFKKPKEKKETATSKLLNNLWAKYGKFGIGFIGTLLVGAPVSIGVGVGFGVQVKQMMTYCLVAVVIRSIAYSYFFSYIKTLF
jgi:membrane protein YqaA with SNARE-associated domain